MFIVYYNVVNITGALIDPCPWSIKPGFHMIVRIVPIVPVVSKNVQTIGSILWKCYPDDRKRQTNIRSAYGVIWNQRNSVTSSFRRDTMSSGNYSRMSMLENQEKKQIPRYKVRFTNKNHPFMWLVCKTRTKILLCDPETSPTTLRLLPLRRRDDHMETTNHPSLPHRLEIFWND